MPSDKQKLALVIALLMGSVAVPILVMAWVLPRACLTDHPYGA